MGKYTSEGGRERNGEEQGERREEQRDAGNNNKKITAPLRVSFLFFKLAASNEYK